ncbi:hypothetical protein PAPYR_6503 [Paratrimastix pyriformis]|uniref:Chromatin modification-related protein MEAF6 n=1 Tax=Paratrimastix pyriformis TaxID=342808 RepID=A0ABQ8UJE5_9EUKA|nr:hypothetical protein PAPYR_6503 [Paratrimastix pyriformis]
MSSDLLQRLQDELLNVEMKLEDLEKQIFLKEEEYLDTTSHHGNVVRGFAAYRGGGSGAQRGGNFKSGDRLFSLSSLSSPARTEVELSSLPAPSPALSQPARNRKRDPHKNSKASSSGEAEDDDDYDD